MKVPSKSDSMKCGKPVEVTTEDGNSRFSLGLAHPVIAAEPRWELSCEEAANVAEMIANPPKSNKKMVNAAKLASREVIIRS